MVPAGRGNDPRERLSLPAARRVVFLRSAVRSCRSGAVAERLRPSRGQGKWQRGFSDHVLCHRHQAADYATEQTRAAERDRHVRTLTLGRASTDPSLLVGRQRFQSERGLRQPSNTGKISPYSASRLMPWKEDPAPPHHSVRNSSFAATSPPGLGGVKNPLADGYQGVWGAAASEAVCCEARRGRGVISSTCVSACGAYRRG